MCSNCPGKRPHHPYNIWHEKVKDSDPRSECKHCKIRYQPVPRGQEVGVKLCHFHCSKCGNKFVSICEMSDTAPCYNYKCSEGALSPCSFEKLRKINRKTDNKHNCSKCNGKGNCPNLRVFNQLQQWEWWIWNPHSRLQVARCLLCTLNNLMLFFHILLQCCDLCFMHNIIWNLIAHSQYNNITDLAIFIWQHNVKSTQRCEVNNQCRFPQL